MTHRRLTYGLFSLLAYRQNEQSIETAAAAFVRYRECQSAENIRAKYFTARINLHKSENRKNASAMHNMRVEYAFLVLKKTSTLIFNLD